MAEEDIIFGKNRHFFGGLEPSNMTTFTVAVENGEVKINAQLPAHTVVDGQTLCTVAGAVIRRDPSDYPKDEFDGELVADITASTTFVDHTADPAGSYFYRAFPYSTKGVYNRNLANKAAINEPEPMVKFSAKSVNSTVQLTVDMPDSAVGVVIRKSNMGYPVNENDGEEVMNVTSDGVYTDSNVIVGLTYYYSAFPYTSNGGYNRSETNRASIGVKKYGYLFGYDLNTVDSDPDTRVSYPSDVDNAEYSPAYMNYTANTFNYGDWNIVPGDKFMPNPCVLGYTGTVLYYLDPNDYTKKDDGTASNVALASLEGNVMMEWPKIYTKRWEENGIYHFRCSDMKHDDSWDCWCNYDSKNNEIDHFYTAAYTGYVSSNVLRSISGTGAESTHTSITNYFTYARANGDDWCIEVIADHLLIQDLLVMMAKSTDCQTAYGTGHVYEDYSNYSDNYIAAGSMNTKGMFWGSNGTTSGLKVFGMENYWGNISRRIAGWTADNEQHYVKITRGTHDGSTIKDYTFDKNTWQSGYIKVPNAIMSGTSGGYISGMKTTSFGRIPVAANGSATTYEGDQMAWHSSSSSGGLAGSAVAGIAIFNGALMQLNRTVHGPFTVVLNANTQSGTSSTSVRASLSCKPLAT